MRKMSTNPYLVLEGCKGSSNDLITVKSTKKREMEQEIRTNLNNWMKNPRLERISEAPLDVAIVIYVDDMRMKRQDLDNIAKIVLDSIKKSRKFPKRPYLIIDDSQVVRLFLYKLRKIDYEGHETVERYLKIISHIQELFIGRTVCYQEQDIAGRK